MNTQELIDEASALPMEQRLALVDAVLRTLDRPTPASPGESALPSRPAVHRAGELEPETLRVLAAFRKRMAQRYGGRLRGVVLFGSRARGDHRADSDADVAVFLDPVADPVAAQMDMADDAYRLFLDSDLLIQPWVFRGSPDKPDTSRAAHLVEIIRAEGVRV